MIKGQIIDKQKQKTFCTDSSLVEFNSKNTNFYSFP